MAQELFELLQEDHDKLKSRFDDLLELSAVEKRAAAFARVKDVLLPHLAAENQVLYPALRAAANDKYLALVAVEEHFVLELLLSELEQMDMAEERWMPKLQVLSDILDDHIEDEESEVFDLIEETFDDQQMDDLFHQVGNARRAAKGQLAAPTTQPL